MQEPGGGSRTLTDLIVQGAPRGRTEFGCWKAVAANEACVLCPGSPAICSATSGTVISTILVSELRRRAGQTIATEQEALRCFLAPYFSKRIGLTGHHDPFVGCACSTSQRISSARQTVVRSQSLIGAGYLPDLQPLNQLVRLMGMIGST